MINTSTLDRWLKVASVVASCAVVPGVAWAFRTTMEIHDLQNRAERLDMKIDANSTHNVAVLEEVRAVRTSVEALRGDVLQRLTRVETRIDSHIQQESKK